MHAAKIFSITAVIVAALSMTACGSGSQSPADKREAHKQASAAPTASKSGHSVSYSVSGGKGRAMTVSFVDSDGLTKVLKTSESSATRTVEFPTYAGPIAMTVISEDAARILACVITIDGKQVAAESGAGKTNCTANLS